MLALRLCLVITIVSAVQGGLTSTHHQGEAVSTQHFVTFHRRGGHGGDFGNSQLLESAEGHLDNFQEARSFPAGFQIYENGLSEEHSSIGLQGSGHSTIEGGSEGFGYEGNSLDGQSFGAQGGLNNVHQYSPSTVYGLPNF